MIIRAWVWSVGWIQAVSKYTRKLPNLMNMAPSYHLTEEVRILSSSEVTNFIFKCFKQLMVRALNLIYHILFSGCFLVAVPDSCYDSSHDGLSYCWCSHTDLCNTSPHNTLYFPALLGSLLLLILWNFVTSWH